MIYYSGHIDPWWTFEHRNLDYQEAPYNDVQQISSWTNLGYKNLKFFGELAPAHKLNQPFVKKFYSLFDWDNTTVSFCRLKTEQFLPLHRDHYLTYQKLFNVSIPQTICRCIIFLENWVSGHYFDIEGYGMTNWRAGDYVVWKYDAIHSAGNVGVIDRYTAQLTGTAKNIELFYTLQKDLI